MKTPALGSCLVLFLSLFAHAAEIDSARSRIQVHAQATGHGFTGTLTKFRAKVAGDDATMEPKSFSMDWSFADLQTGDDKRDAEMIKWLGGGNPQGSFKFNKFWIDAQGKKQAQGVLTLHGVSKTISFPYTTRRSDETVIINGKAGMNYEQFNLPLIRAMLVMTVDPRLEVEFEIAVKTR